MAYRKPSTAVYQDLENSGGAANTTPDLQAVIIGTLMNEVTIDPNDEKSLLKAKGTEVSHWLAKGDAQQWIPLMINPETTYPGQKIEQDGSVELLLMNVEVKTFGIKATEVKFKEPLAASQMTIELAGNKFADVGENPLATLPLDKGAHVRPGDRVIVTDGAKTIDTSVSNISLKGSVLDLSVTDSLKELDATKLEFEFFHKFVSLPINLFRVNPEGVDLSDLYLGKQQLKLSNLYRVLNTDDENAYTLRSPAQSGGEATQSYIGYRARRFDKSREIMTITQEAGNLESQLGKPTTTNDLALGVSVALANSNTSIRAIAVESDDLEGYKKALSLAGSERVYALALLTSQMDVITMAKAHAQQLSDPLIGKWRVVIVSSDPSDILKLQEKEGVFPMVKSAIGESGGRGNMVITVQGATFLTDGVQPGDMISLHEAKDKLVEGTYKIDQIYNNTMIGIKSSSKEEPGFIPEIETEINKFEIFRNLDSHAKAKNIAGISKSFALNRLWHIGPCLAGVLEDKIEKFVPSYFLGAAVAGMVAGFPVQQGFTNMTLAGFSSLKGSNFYFDDEDMNTMAEAGTMLFVQDNQSSAPYCRHALTTDMTVLEYRESLLVKNWDWLSYFYKDVLDPFIGHWNITDDTITTIRQTIVSASENIKSQKLPRIGPPLIDVEIDSIEQSSTMKDKIDLKLRPSLVYPNNYMDLHLVI